jgi:uncharacterized protein
MLTQEKIISTLEKELPYLRETFHVQRIGIFGSYAKGNYTEESDIDLVVELEKPMGFKFFDLIDYFEMLFKKRVDVMTKVGLESIRVKEVSDRIKQELIYV